MALTATEIIDELQRQVQEFGDGPGEIVDEMEPNWKYPITGVEFDSERQSHIFTSDR